MIPEIFGRVKKHFEFAKHGTNIKTETLAGLSTFLALSYIFVVNPSILGDAGFDPLSISSSQISSLICVIFPHSFHQTFGGVTDNSAHGVDLICS